MVRHDAGSLVWLEFVGIISPHTLLHAESRFCDKGPIFFFGPRWRWFNLAPKLSGSAWKEIFRRPTCHRLKQSTIYRN